MPFPSNGVLDSFTGSDENPIATNWTSSIVSGEAGAQRLGNQFTGSGAGAWGGSYYDLSTFSADSEAYVTVATLSAGEAISIWTRIANPGAGSASGYHAKYTHGSPGTAEIIRMTSGPTFTGIGSTVAVTLAAGEKFGLETVGSTLSCYVFQAGAWSLLFSRTDSTLTNSGYLGLEVFSTTYRLDDFGGGQIASPTWGSHSRVGVAGVA